ncbi:hypothetical protein SOASR015_42330 [Pectobacterium carotovorum subsp. carotovorum]|nr:hypothetical protein SOASR015_42330 [Pectobacterium carotovorum subsp. carotovorum]GLX58957.1 hypothetical protein Pcaca02_42660 [Pectobacterium carotovorum subsp. carotovorum]
MKKDNILLVEGSNDKAFFEKICKKHNLNYLVKVSTPTDLVKSSSGGFNSKQGVLNSLKTLLPLLEDEDSAINKVAIILDADITNDNNGGFSETISQIENKASEHNYKKHSRSKSGIELQHSDNQMNSLGVWVMPDNKSDGTIEDWIKLNIIDSEKELFSHACKIVKELPLCKFSNQSIPKAEIATWLAWQNQPGRTIAYTLKDSNELLNIENSNYTKLIEWLTTFFKDE